LPRPCLGRGLSRRATGITEDISANEPHCDLDQIRRFIKRIDEHNAAWRKWFTSFQIQPHVVLYEELVADMVGITVGLLDFLGLELPDKQTITSGHARQADEINDEWIDRYRGSAESPMAVPES
jgi:LPS sulfotransferase NodH